MVKELTITVTCSANGSGTIEDEFVIAVEEILKDLNKGCSSGMNSRDYNNEKGDPETDEDYVETSYKFETREI